MYFACFQNLSIKVTAKFEKYGKGLRIFANTTSKCTGVREILPYVRGMKVVLGPCIHRKLYISSRVTPCNTILWLHLASWNLPDSQLSWESKMEPSVAILYTPLKFINIPQNPLESLKIP